MNWNSLGQNQWKCLQNQSRSTPKSDPLCSQDWKRELEVRKCLCLAQKTCVGGRVLSVAQLCWACWSTALTQCWVSPGLLAVNFSWLSWSSWNRCPWWWWGWSSPGAPGRRSFLRQSASGCRFRWQLCSQFRTRPLGSVVDCCSSLIAPQGSWQGCHPTSNVWRTASLQTKIQSNICKASCYGTNNYECSKEMWSPEYS